MTNTLDKPLSKTVLVNTRHYHCTLLEGQCKTHGRYELEQLVTVEIRTCSTSHKNDI